MSQQAVGRPERSIVDAHGVHVRARRRHDGAGQTVSASSTSLTKIANAYGVEAQVCVVPNTLFVKLRGSDSSAIDLATGVDLSLRLDQTAEVFDMAQRAERAEISPSDGLRYLGPVLRTPNRYSAAVRIFGHTLIAVGLRPDPRRIPFPVGHVHPPRGLDWRAESTQRGQHGRQKCWRPLCRPWWLAWSSLRSSRPIWSRARYFSYSAGRHVSSWRDADDRDDRARQRRCHLRVESSCGRVTTKLLLLVFGLLVAAELVGLPTAEAFAQVPNPLFGWWAAWLGVLIDGVGNYFHHTAP